MAKSNWEKRRDDKNKIEWILKSDPHVWIGAERTNPAPRMKWQGWNVSGFDRQGTYFRAEGLNFKKDAIVQIEIAKNKYEHAHAERF